LADLGTPDQRPGPPGWIGGPQVVAVGQGGRRVVSPNGLDWTGDLLDTPGDRDPTKDLLAVSYAGGLVVAVGGGCVGAACAGRIVTFDGDRWTEATLPSRGGRGGAGPGQHRWQALDGAGELAGPRASAGLRQLRRHPGVRGGGRRRAAGAQRGRSDLDGGGSGLPRQRGAAVAALGGDRRWHCGGGGRDGAADPLAQRDRLDRSGGGRGRPGLGGVRRSHL